VSTPVHVTDILDGSTPLSWSDRIRLGVKLALANAAGSTAGSPVAVPVTFSEALPPQYAVSVDAGQECISWVTAKTGSGFTVNLAPYPSTATLAAGSINVTVVG
jgi:hypothetical protein